MFEFEKNVVDALRKGERKAILNEIRENWRWIVFAGFTLAILLRCLDMPVPGPDWAL